MTYSVRTVIQKTCALQSLKGQKGVGEKKKVEEKVRDVSWIGHLTFPFWRHLKWILWEGPSSILQREGMMRGAF